jgi:hypothetical protein
MLRRYVFKAQWQDDMYWMYSAGVDDTLAGGYDEFRK